MKGESPKNFMPGRATIRFQISISKSDFSFSISSLPYLPLLLFLARFFLLSLYTVLYICSLNLCLDRNVQCRLCENILLFWMMWDRVWSLRMSSCGLTGYSPWGRKDSDTTEWLAHTFLICEFPHLEDYKAFRFPNLALDNIYIL